MANPTAKPLDNTDKYPWRLARTPQGYQGEKAFQINGAGSYEECFGADGLPPQGSAWSESLVGRRLFAADFEPFRDGGGWFGMRVAYRENRGGGLVVPADGLKITSTIRHEQTTEQVEYDVTGTVRLPEGGAAKILSAFSILVDQYFASPDAMVALLASARDLADEPKLNRNAVSCPNLFGSGRPLLIPARTGLYVAFEPDREGDFYRLRHTVYWRRDWKVGGVIHNDDMKPIGSFPPEDIYEDADWAGVFPE